MEPQAHLSKVLEIQLFGTPRLSWNGAVPIGIAGGKPFALFIYLATTRRPHARDLLADLLWSELSNQQARDNLRYVLPEIRKHLSSYLVVSTQSIHFNDALPYHLDAETVRDTLSSPSAVALPVLQAALDLYQGEFLAGFRVRNAPLFEEWVRAQQEEFHQLIVQGLQQLAKCYIEDAKYQSALIAAQRLITLDPLAEEGHRLKMHALASSGQRVGALDVYDQLQQLFQEELGLQPSAETLALFKQIKSGEHSLAEKLPVTQIVVAQEATGSTATVPADLSTMSLPASVRHNLPSPPTPFFGREQEITDICQQLNQRNCRLVTLVGEGGVGKTRMALAVANVIYQQSQFTDGIWVVELSEITTAADLTDKLAGAVATASGLRFSGKLPLLSQVLHYLRDKTCLLLFDNAEHLLPKVTSFLLKFMEDCPRITFLVTSRHTLNLQAEFIWRVTGLSVPPKHELPDLPLTVLRDYSGIALFVERARRVNHNFQITMENKTAIVAICNWVEGLPLAIELAAALTKQYTCVEIDALLQRDFTALTTTFADLPPKHRSVKAILDYSWRFLTADEASILAVCSIFDGGFTRDAAKAVAGAPALVLTKLVDQSLLQVYTGRFSMHKLVRQYAATQLAQTSENQQRALAHHAKYYIALLHGQGAALLAHFDAQAVVQRELDNIRAAWLWIVSQGNLTLLEMGAESLQYYCRLTGLYHEAIHLLDAAITVVRRQIDTILANASLSNTTLSNAAFSDPPSDPSSLVSRPRRLLAYMLCYSTQFYRRTGALEMGARLANEALELGQRLVDPALQGLAYHELARLARGEFPTMCLLAEQACIQADAANLPYLRAECLNDLGIAVSTSTGPLAAIHHFRRALDSLYGLGNHYLEAFVLTNLGAGHLAGHEYQYAHDYLQQSLALQHRLRDQAGSVPSLVHMGDLWTVLGNYTDAQTSYEQALLIMQAVDDPYWKSRLYISYGHLQRLCGDPVAAHTACTHASELAQKSKLPVQEQWALIELGHILTDLLDYTTASSCYQQAIDSEKQDHWLFRAVDAHVGLATLLCIQGQVTAAVVHAEAALTILEERDLTATSKPFAAYWRCISILRDSGDPRTLDVLRTAYQQLQEIALKVDDKTLRRSFLGNVEVNRMLINMAQSEGIT